MPNYYKGQPGFSYFLVPNLLLDLRPKMQDFSFDFWLLLHSRIQHQKDPRVMLTDDQIAEFPIWGGRRINAKEISRARTLLKKLGVLSYRKEGKAYWYFVVHPMTGFAIDPVQAKLEQKEAQKATAESSEVAQLKAEVARLKNLMAKPIDVITRVPVVPTVDYDELDTGEVLD